MRKMFSTVLFLLVSVASGLHSDENSDQVDQIFAAWDKTTTPGISLAIIKDGQIIYKRGYGMAKLEDSIIMTTDKIFDIASSSKQFTAACIAILIRDGKIGLNDDIRKFLPEMPQYENPILIKHLIYHTSGLRDYDVLLGLAGFRPDDCPTVKEAFEIICLQKGLNHLPGEKFSYTNTGYFLMSQIVERVSSMSLNAFAKENIFKPLGMTHTLFQDNHNQIIHNRASAYSPTATGYQFDMSNWDMAGDGNLYTCVDDLYLWDQSFYNDRLGKDLMNMLQIQGILNNENKIDYAFGLTIEKYKGLKIVKHAGAWAGFRSEIMRFPQQHFSVICLANLSSQNPTAFCEQIADIYLSSLYQETPSEQPSAISLTNKELEGKVGNFHDPKLGVWLTISIKDNQLMFMASGKEVVLTPVSSTFFKVVGSPISIQFQTNDNGIITGAILKLKEQELYHLLKAAPFIPPSVAELKEYIGEYISSELMDAVYRIGIDHNTLAVKVRSEQFSLKSMAHDQFSEAEISINFFREDGKIAGFILNSGGQVIGVKFIKRSSSTFGK